MQNLHIHGGNKDSFIHSFIHRSAESQYLRCTNNSNKSALRTLYLNKRKDFDKLVQQSKRCYWHQCQEDLLYMNNNDSKQFWRKIGNIGIYILTLFPSYRRFCMY